MARRKAIPEAVQTELLVRCRRKCCLCFFLNDRREKVSGQIAHVDRNPGDARLENLVYLCLEHHDEFDSKTSQSKGLTSGEVRHYRDQLVELLKPQRRSIDGEQPNRTTQTPSEIVEEQLSQPWRFPLWQNPDEISLFAYKAPNLVDGVCGIEVFDLPDGRKVVACIQFPGNPGNSITNSVEYICQQICARFEIDPCKLVWLENYDYINPSEWDWVTFKITPPAGPFDGPMWETMTPAHWQSLGLRPLKRPTIEFGNIKSKLRKLF